MLLQIEKRRIMRSIIVIIALITHVHTKELATNHARTLVNKVVDDLNDKLFDRAKNPLPQNLPLFHAVLESSALAKPGVRRPYFGSRLSAQLQASHFQRPAPSSKLPLPNPFSLRFLTPHSLPDRSGSISTRAAC